MPTLGHLQEKRRSKDLGERGTAHAIFKPHCLTFSKILLTIAVGQFMGRGWAILEPRKREQSQQMLRELGKGRKKQDRVRSRARTKQRSFKGPRVRQGEGRMMDGGKARQRYRTWPLKQKCRGWKDGSLPH